ncbi:hypothetical protein [Amycolatopsis sp. PS_44_ISF1]|uniref:hypothetical protein n=1 Tax=Amycolatopsis sp. PS_44_ISF1 TaxID=2974917 RepID=UPI0028DF2A23|nr:hypothetical protein [Amycolatopsis sp. PS_44_ISF1]MDT8909961.1 hypothetical protein [Amycolatopsis sp. PS_44_ISF1]
MTALVVAWLSVLRAAPEVAWLSALRAAPEVAWFSAFVAALVVPGLSAFAVSLVLASLLVLPVLRSAPVAELSVELASELVGRVWPVLGAVWAEVSRLGLLEWEVGVELGLVASWSPGAAESLVPVRRCREESGAPSLVWSSVCAGAVATVSPEAEPVPFSSSADALAFASTAPSSHPARASPPASAIRAVGRASGPAHALGRRALTPVQVPEPGPPAIRGARAAVAGARALESITGARTPEPVAGPKARGGTAECTGIVPFTPPPPSAPEARAVSARS